MDIPTHVSAESLKAQAFVNCQEHLFREYLAARWGKDFQILLDEQDGIVEIACVNEHVAEAVENYIDKYDGYMVPDMLEGWCLAITFDGVPAT